MNKKVQIYLLFVIAIFMMNILSGCTDNKSVSKGSSKQDIAQISSNNTDSSSSLSIGSGCTGCGHCVRFDSEHFAYSDNGRIPQVISQSNLSSSNLQIAVNNCRVNAIKLSVLNS